MHTNGGRAAQRCQRVRWLTAVAPLCSSDCVCRGRLTVSQCRQRFDCLLAALLAET